MKDCSITFPMTSTLPPPKRSEITKEVSAVEPYTIIIPLTIPGTVSGRMIRKKVIKLLAPKSLAASIVSLRMRTMRIVDRQDHKWKEVIDHAKYDGARGIQQV